MNNKNIILIGMPGAGKSTIGVLLAKALRKPFVDTDLLIQESENRYLQDIIDSDGIDRFLQIEERTILNLNVKNHLIATGGSAVYSEAAISHLKGKAVYLKLDLEEIEKRIRNIKSRGIALKKGESLSDLYKERIPLYEKYADIVIDCSGKGVEEIVNEIKIKAEQIF
jgi:shikimate kinase